MPFFVLWVIAAAPANTVVNAGLFASWVLAREPGLVEARFAHLLSLDGLARFGFKVVLVDGFAGVVMQLLAVERL